MPFWLKNHYLQAVEACADVSGAPDSPRHLVDMLEELQPPIRLLQLTANPAMMYGQVVSI